MRYNSIFVFIWYVQTSKRPAGRKVSYNTHVTLVGVVDPDIACIPSAVAIKPPQVLNSKIQVNTALCPVQSIDSQPTYSLSEYNAASSSAQQCRAQRVLHLQL